MGLPGHVGRCSTPAGPWRLGALAFCLVLAGCGGGNSGNAAPEIPSLNGDREPAGQSTAPAAIDLGLAPTEAHKRLAALLPLDSLKRDSVLYAAWNGAISNLSDEDPARAAMPAVSAEYRSAGFRIVDDGPKANAKRAEMDYPQRCVLTLISTPEVLAAETVAEKLREHLLAKGFEVQEPLAIGINTRIKPEIQRFGRVDTQGDADNVYIAYVKVMGTTVLYALEIETPPKLTGPGSEQIQRVIKGQRGSRVGAQLITLILERYSP